MLENPWKLFVYIYWINDTYILFQTLLSFSASQGSLKVINDHFYAKIFYHIHLKTDFDENFSEY